MLSDHFLFSKFWTGSKRTGYVRTNEYRRDGTKLAQAMTISAAAVGSGMGFRTFFAQTFATTLFNLRLGFWIENPWYYRGLKPEKGPVKEPAKKGSKLRSLGRKIVKELAPDPALRKWTCWPGYLVRELLGNLNARERLVNVSDGGFTGDNLGLFPLLQRRRKTIFICDGEADGDYSFNSFNNAVRMAYVEENVKVVIPELKRIVPEKKDGTFGPSATSVAIGDVIYPPKKGKGDCEYGKIYYLKSSVTDDVPVHVTNYQKKHPDFPHQTTADQWFDDSQFESYRALGEHVAQEIVGRLEQTRSESTGGVKKSAGSKKRR